MSNLENSGKVKGKNRKEQNGDAVSLLPLVAGPQAQLAAVPSPLPDALCVIVFLGVLFQVAVNGANLQNVFMLLTLEPLLARSPFLVLHVRRNNLVGDALRELSIHSDIDLKKPLKVSPSFYSSKYLPGFSLNGVDETAEVLLLKLWSAAIHDFFHSFHKNLITSFCQIIKQNISA